MKAEESKTDRSAEKNGAASEQKSDRSADKNGAGAEQKPDRSAGKNIAASEQKSDTSADKNGAGADLKPDNAENDAGRDQLAEGMQDETMWIRRKKRNCVILVILFAIAAAAFQLMISTALEMSERSEDNRIILKSFSEYVDYIVGQINAADYSFKLDFGDNAEITAAALREAVFSDKNESEEHEDDSRSARLYEDGCIFICDGEQTVFPEGLPSGLQTEKITAAIEDGWEKDCIFDRGDDDTEVSDLDPNTYLVAFALIKDSYYYMEWLPYDNYAYELTDDFNAREIFSALDGTYDGELLRAKHYKDGSTRVDWSTIGYTDADTEEFGLSWDMIEESLNGRHSYKRYSLNSGTYMLQSEIIDTDDGDEYQTVAILLMPLEPLLERSKGVIVTFMIMMLIFSAVLIVWIISSYDALRKGVVSDDESLEYRPSGLRKKVIIYVAAVIAVTGAGCIFAHNLGDVFTESKYAENALTNISQDMDACNDLDESGWSKSRELNLSKTALTASLLEKYPELQTSEWLEEISGIISADYMILYDHNGDEIVSDSAYEEMSLGTDEASATYDFRRLLKGVKSIAHDEVTDEVTEEIHDMYGISLKYGGKGSNKGYGALIAYTDPIIRTAVGIADIDKTLVAYSLGRHIAFTVDPETGVIQNSSYPECIGNTAYTYGMDENQIRSSFIGSFQFMGVTCFGRSISRDGLLYYYAAQRYDVFAHSGMYGLICMLLMLAIMAVISWILLSGYDEKMYYHFVSESYTGKQEKAAADQGKDREIKKIFRNIGISGKPAHKALMTFLMLAVLCLIFISSVYLNGRDTNNETNSVIQYIMKGDWARGFNLFSASAILFLTGSTVVIIALLYVVKLVLDNVLEPRGRTISALIINIMQYLTGIAAVFMSLGYLGVDYKAMLASVGIASMAISFGAKDLIADMFAGLNLLANDTYQVGDIIDIGGYSGSVQEVNLRTTRIIGRGGNIKTIRNSTIGDVVNLSRKNSWYAAQMTVSATSDLRKIEAMFADNLPEIKKKYPIIISGPEYRGVESIDGGKMKLLVLTECSQENYNKVQRAVNRELRNLFKANDIELL